MVYASRAGSTKGIAEFIAERLRGRGIDTDARDVESAKDLAGYDAFVVGSALYYFHWLKEAKQFLSQNRGVLAGRPVWMFSSGPTGSTKTDKKGRDLKDVSGPSEIADMRAMVNPRDHRVFFGAIYRDRLKGKGVLFARFIPKEAEGDFRHWSEIGATADGLADSHPLVHA